MIESIRNPVLDLKEQRAELDLVQALNRHHLQRFQPVAEFEARIQSLELAFRMQTAATDVFDISRESEHVRKSFEQ